MEESGGRATSAAHFGSLWLTAAGAVAAHTGRRLAGPLSAAQFWLMCRAVTEDDVAQRRAQRKVATSLRSSR